jgi:hypothetical protein
MIAHVLYLVVKNVLKHFGRGSKTSLGPDNSEAEASELRLGFQSLGDLLELNELGFRIL